MQNDTFNKVLKTIKEVKKEGSESYRTETCII